MDKNATYAAVSAKIHAMMGEFLTEEDYKNILNLRTPSEIATYLKERTSYKKAFEGINTYELHRGQIEIVLKKHLIGYIDKLIHYFHGDIRNFIKCLYIKYEIFDLKNIARTIHVEKNYDEVKESLVFVGKYRFIDVEKIIKAKKVSELIEALDGTIYYPYVKNLIDGNERENLFRFEMSLDRSYFNILNDSAKKLSKEDKNAFNEIYGSLADLLNLKWIYRSKKFFNLTPEEIFNYTIDFGNKFNYEKIKGFCYTKDMDEFLSKARNTPYSFLFKGDPKQDIYMERRINRFMFYKIKKILYTRNLNLSLVLAFLELKEFEIFDIISMLECVRYALSFDEAKTYLIRNI